MSQNVPKIAIVGRPNVGKSALFNRICKKRLSIVDEAEGVTRDRLYARAEFFGRPFEVIDTGGIHFGSNELFSEHIRLQAEIAVAEADSLIMVVDAKIGPTHLDHEVASLLLKSGKPLCLAVNKVDNLGNEALIHNFYGLGISQIKGVSATQNWQIAELLEAALTPIPQQDEEEGPPPPTQIAIVGRPNVGKSTLINKLLGTNRCIVSPIPGTTRDSVDVTVTFEGNRYTFVDTAGIRRKKAEHEVVDKFAAMRTASAIERADICLLIADAQQGFTTQEKQIARQIEQSGKGCILLLNKWDLVKGFRMEHSLKQLEEELTFLKFCPKLIISAQEGRNVEKIFPEIEETAHSFSTRLPTPQINSFFEETMQKVHPPMINGKRMRIYYATQVKRTPPTFLLFVNRAELVCPSYKRYLINQFRKRFPFKGAPIVFHLKSKRAENPYKSAAS